jgi:predicted transposase YbfD/YdcC
VDENRRTGKSETHAVEYYLTSLDPTRANASELLRWIRAYGAIESQLHPVRDGTFDEGHSRGHQGSSAEVMAALRNVAIPLLSGGDAVSHRAATHRILADQPGCFNQAA